MYLCMYVTHHTINVIKEGCQVFRKFLLFVEFLNDICVSYCLAAREKFDTVVLIIVVVILFVFVLTIIIVVVVSLADTRRPPPPRRTPSGSTSNNTRQSGSSHVSNNDFFQAVHLENNSWTFENELFIIIPDLFLMSSMRIQFTVTATLFGPRQIALKFYYSLTTSFQIW